MNDRHPEHGLDHTQVRNLIRAVFPWYRHDVAHMELSEPEAWWSHIIDGINRVLVEGGLPPDVAADMSKTMRAELMDPETWEVYPDALPALQRVHDAGWTNVVLSNHAPELDQVVEGVGLAHVIDDVVTSARVGYEKPNPEIYRSALKAVGEPSRVWMIGDNPIADVAGAEKAGIAAILVRVDDFNDAYRQEVERVWGKEFFPGWTDHVHRVSSDLHGAADIVLAPE